MKNEYNKIKVIAVNNKAKSGFDIYLEFSGRREYLMPHRHNAILYNILKNGISLRELKSGRPYKICSRVQAGHTAVKHEGNLAHIIRTVDWYLEDSREQTA